MSTNREKFFRQELICGICLDLYKIPVTIACGHTFCKYCISEISLDSIVCPLCRKTHPRDALKVNIVLQNLVSALKEEDSANGRLEATTVNPHLNKIWWSTKISKVSDFWSNLDMLLFRPFPAEKNACFDAAGRPYRHGCCENLVRFRLTN